MEEEKKLKKQSLIIMLVLAVMFIIGILTRWDFTKRMVKESVMEYFEPTDTSSNFK